MRRFPGPAASCGRRLSIGSHYAALCLTVVFVFAQGCASTGYVKVRSTPESPLAERLQLTSRKGPQASVRTVQLLRRYGLENQQREPERALEQLTTFVRDEPHPEGYYAMSELAFIAAKQREGHDESHALDLYGASVAHAYLYLFDPTIGFQRNPYDPQFRGACDLYNGALEGALRILARHDALVAGSSREISAGGRQWQVDIVARGNRWQAEDFESFEFVSDFDVSGLPNHYRTYGLGVPLIGVRRHQPEAAPEEKYYPPGMSLPVTAFLSVIPEAHRGALDGRVHRCVLELHDTLNVRDIVVDTRRIPLESDLTTPLAYFLDQAEIDDVSLAGLLRPEAVEQVAGLYMAQPYEPDKIPVLMIHGLYSSPMTWMEMFNDLRAQPELREHYQFWFYLYPTGQPFWISAAHLRVDLMRLREELDPQRRSPALDHMVLVGHSMGGLLARMQIVNSGNEFWKLVTDQPFQLVKAETEVRTRLQSAFFFQPNGSVRRVVSIGTPFRGSHASNSTTQYAAQRLIRLPTMLLTRQQQLFRDNPDLFPHNTLLATTNSIQALAPDSPILPVLLNAPPAPWVHIHNIVGVTEDQGIVGRFSASGRGDGVVSYESAHLDHAESELVVDADHLTVHRHPLAVLEVRRILHEHLADLRAYPKPQAPRVWTASLEQGPVAAPRTGGVAAWPNAGQHVAPYAPVGAQATAPRNGPQPPMGTPSANSAAPLFPAPPPSAAVLPPQ